MMKIIGLLLFASLALQDDVEKRARDLVEALRSRNVEERESATRKLKEMGDGALTELTRATKDEDAEVAARARHLVKVIGILPNCTAELRKAIPGVEERLTQDDYEWMLVYLEATERDENGRQKFPALGRRDLDPLAAAAVRGARTDEERGSVCERLSRLPLPSSAPEVAKLIKDRYVQWTALQLLGTLRYKEAIPEISPLLKDEDAAVQGRAAKALGELDAKEKAPEIAELLMLKKRVPAAKERGLGNPPTRAWAGAIEALGHLGYKKALPEIIRFLDEPDVFVRAATAEALYLLDARETAPKLVPLLKDADIAVNRNTLRALLSWDSREIIPEIVKLLEDSELHVRMSALELLGALRAKEAAPKIAAFLKNEVPYVRGIAADALCLLGSREGIPVLLEEGMEQQLTSLNKFRQPEVWERLRLKKLKQDLEGRGKEIEEQWSREAGVALDTSREVEALKLREVDNWSTIRSNGGRANLWEAMMESALSSYEFILERDRIRVVSRQEALAFWRKWWESLPPKDR